MTLIAIGLLFAAFFVLAYLSRRRFGTLGLALAAGALLASHLTVWLAGQITYLDIPTGSLSERTAANIVLTLSPALILLMSGPSYTKKHQAVIGALAFALMATLLLIVPLATYLPSDQVTRAVLPFVASYSDLILAATIALAVVDAWLTHNLPGPRKKGKNSD